MEIWMDEWIGWMDGWIDSVMPRSCSSTLSLRRPRRHLPALGALHPPPSPRPLIQYLSTRRVPSSRAKSPEASSQHLHAWAGVPMHDMRCRLQRT